ncbi:5,6-dimethylbenzimidazole synthase [Sphingomonas sp. LR55]|uniref:5,6-dimethylbenzimidazole synthase n=1 Tax=Sphingomonas sp. LR55 TaxID=3050231 RepID=UPI002FE397D4
MTADTPPVFEADFAAQFDTLLRWRRDVRHFLPTPITDADLRALLETAALAPSVGNAQPWRFVRVRSPRIRAHLADHVDAANAVAANAQPDLDRRAHYRSLKLHGLREAPEVVAVFSDEAPLAGYGLGRTTMHDTLRYSTVMAIHTLWLAARLRGIGVGWVSILDPATVTAMLETPEDWTLIAVLCLGYPEHPSTIPELERRDWQHREPVADRIIER